MLICRIKDRDNQQIPEVEEDKVTLVISVGQGQNVQPKVPHRDNTIKEIDNQRLFEVEEDKGRRFLACPQLNGERCIYFDWVDLPMCQRAMMIIPGMLRVRNMIEAEMMMLVQANRKLKKYLIFSWLAFAFFLLLS
ncbi:hypothetical protein Tco_1248493 [Tanacetum coccineum]